MSGSRDKSLQDKLKVFFKKTPTGEYGGSSGRWNGLERGVEPYADGSVCSLFPVLPVRNELAVTGEVERELNADTPLHRRLRAIKDIGDKAIVVRVQEVRTLAAHSSTYLQKSHQHCMFTHLSVYFSLL